VEYAKETNLYLIRTLSLLSINMFLNSLELDKNYVCSIEFIPNITEYNYKFHRFICERFLGNWYSSSDLIIKNLILMKIVNKSSFRSELIINYWEIINI
jgi:hypothetical protein